MHYLLFSIFFYIPFKKVKKRNKNKNDETQNGNFKNKKIKNSQPPITIVNQRMERVLEVDQLTDDHLRAIFESAAFERYDRTLEMPDDAAIDAWVAALRQKIGQVSGVTCEGN